MSFGFGFHGQQGVPSRTSKASSSYSSPPFATLSPLTHPYQGIDIDPVTPTQQNDNAGIFMEDDLTQHARINSLFEGDAKRDTDLNRLFDPQVNPSTWDREIVNAHVPIYPQILDQTLPITEAPERVQNGDSFGKRKRLNTSYQAEASGSSTNVWKKAKIVGPSLSYSVHQTPNMIQATTTNSQYADFDLVNPDRSSQDMQAPIYMITEPRNIQRSRSNTTVAHSHSAYAIPKSGGRLVTPRYPSSIAFSPLKANNAVIYAPLASDSTVYGSDPRGSVQGHRMVDSGLDTSTSPPESSRSEIRMNDFDAVTDQPVDRSRQPTAVPPMHSIQDLHRPERLGQWLSVPPYLYQYYWPGSRSPYVVRKVLDPNHPSGYRVEYERVHDTGYAPTVDRDEHNYETAPSHQPSMLVHPRLRPQMNLNHGIAQNQAKTGVHQAPLHSQSTTSVARKLQRGHNSSHQPNSSGPSNSAVSRGSNLSVSNISLGPVKTISQKKRTDGSWRIEGFPKRWKTTDATLLNVASTNPTMFIKEYFNDLHWDCLYIIAQNPKYNSRQKLLDAIRKYHNVHPFNKLAFDNRFTHILGDAARLFGPLDGFRHKEKGGTTLKEPKEGWHDAKTWREKGMFNTSLEDEKEQVQREKAKLKKAIKVARLDSNQQNPVSIADQAPGTLNGEDFAQLNSGFQDQSEIESSANTQHDGTETPAQGRGSTHSSLSARIAEAREDVVTAETQAAALRRLYEATGEDYGIATAVKNSEDIFIKLAKLLQQEVEQDLDRQLRANRSSPSTAVRVSALQFPANQYGVNGTSSATLRPVPHDQSVVEQRSLRASQMRASETGYPAPGRDPQQNLGSQYGPGSHLESGEPNTIQRKRGRDNDDSNLPHQSKQIKKQRVNDDGSTNSSNAKIQTKTLALVPTAMSTPESRTTLTALPDNVTENAAQRHSNAPNLPPFQLSTSQLNGAQQVRVQIEGLCRERMGDEATWYETSTVDYQRFLRDYMILELDFNLGDQETEYDDRVILVHLRDEITEEIAKMGAMESGAATVSVSPILAPTPTPVPRLSTAITSASLPGPTDLDASNNTLASETFIESTT